MMRLVLILTLTVALGGCLQSGRFGRSQPAQPAVEATETAPLGAVDTPVPISRSLEPFVCPTPERVVTAVRAMI